MQRTQQVQTPDAASAAPFWLQYWDISMLRCELVLELMTFAPECG